jgi:hypothetical protein
MTSSRIEPVTFRLVTWYLNNLRYRVPQDQDEKQEIKEETQEENKRR